MDLNQEITDIEYLVIESEIKFTLFIDDVDGDLEKSTFSVLVYTEDRSKGVELEFKDIQKRRTGEYVCFADSTNMGIGKVNALVKLKLHDPEHVNSTRILNKLVTTNIVLIP